MSIGTCMECSWCSATAILGAGKCSMCARRFHTQTCGTLCPMEEIQKGEKKYKYSLREYAGKPVCSKCLKEWELPTKQGGPGTPVAGNNRNTEALTPQPPTPAKRGLRDGKLILYTP